MADILSAQGIISIVIAFAVMILLFSIAGLILGNAQSSLPSASAMTFQINNESVIINGNQTIVALNIPAGSTLISIISVQNDSTLIPSDQYNITGNGIGIMFNGSYRST